MTDIDVLGRYNAEISRGIMHTPEWQAKMAELQSRFDVEQYARMMAMPNAVDFGGCIIYDSPKRWWWRR